MAKLQNCCTYTLVTSSSWQASRTVSTGAFQELTYTCHCRREKQEGRSRWKSANRMCWTGWQSCSRSRTCRNMYCECSAALPMYIRESWAAAACSQQLLLLQQLPLCCRHCYGAHASLGPTQSQLKYIACMHARALWRARHMAPSTDCAAAQSSSTTNGTKQTVVGL